MTSSSSDGHPPSAPLYQDPVGTLRQFLSRGGTGCMFAAAFATAKDGPILWVELNIPESLDDLNARAILDGFREAASRQHAVGLVFPSARDEDDLVRLVAALHKMEGWSISELGGDERPKGVPGDAGVFSALWRPVGGDDVSVMLLGPFGWLPVHRRAPYLTLMSWTGTRMNDLLSDSLKQRARPVGFIDMPIREPFRSGYEKMWATSGENATCMRAHARVDVNRAARPHVAFTVSPKAAELIRRTLTA